MSAHEQMTNIQTALGEVHNNIPSHIPAADTAHALHVTADLLDRERVVTGRSDFGAACLRKMAEDIFEARKDSHARYPHSLPRRRHQTAPSI